MRWRTADIEADDIYLYTIGDLHIGDRNCATKRLKEYIGWMLKPNRYCILTGDLLNVATKDGVSNQAEQNMDLDEQKDFGCALFEPLAERGRILAAVTGNHENRIHRVAGGNPMRDVCRVLKVPYLGYSGKVTIRLHGKGRGKKSRQKYVVYVHHTCGGGDTPGGKLNRVYKLAQIYPHADIYVGGHGHFEIICKTGIFTDDGDRLKQRDRLFISAGAFLKYADGYSEEKQMIPGTVGCPSINLRGDKWAMEAKSFVREVAA